MDPITTGPPASGNRKRTLATPGVLLGVIIAVCVLVVVLLQLSSGPEVFTVDGKKYNQKEVQQLIAYPEHIGSTRDAAAKEAFTDLKQVKAAEKVGYVFSAADITNQKQQIYKNLNVSKQDQQKYADWFTLAAQANSINQNITLGMNGIYAGYSYVFFFGQHLQAIPGYTISGFGNTTLIASDRSYAHQKATYYYNQLKSHKLTPEQALIKSIASMQARGKGDNNLNFSTRFGPSAGGYWANGIYFSPIVHYISTLKNTGLSQVKVGQAPNKSGPGAKQVDMYYYFVDLTSASPAVSYQAYQQTLKDLPAQYEGFKS